MEAQLLRVPLNRIRPSASNPRKCLTEASILAQMASMKSVGQKTPIKLRPLTDQERSSDPSHDFEILGGHLRYEAAKRLEWGEIEGIVRNIPLPMVLLESVLDNESQDLYWLELFEAIEAMAAADGSLTQESIADQLGISQATVSKALSLTSAFTPGMRSKIYSRLINHPQGGLSEGIAYRLSALRTEDPASLPLLESALDVVLERKLTENQTASLVRWVQKGMTPASFPAARTEKGDAEAGGDPTDPLTEYWKDLPMGFKVRLGKAGYRCTMDLPREDAAIAVYGALAAVEHRSGGSDGRYARALEKLLAPSRPAAASPDPDATRVDIRIPSDVTVEQQAPSPSLTDRLKRLIR